MAYSGNDCQSSVTPEQAYKVAEFGPNKYVLKGTVKPKTKTKSQTNTQTKKMCDKVV